MEFAERAKGMKLFKDEFCPKNPRSVEISLPLPPTVSCSSTVHFLLKEYAFRRVGDTLFTGNNWPSGRPPRIAISKRTHLSSLPLQLKSPRFLEAWSTVRRPCFTRSYFGDTMAWIRWTGCLFPTRARERTSCGSHRDQILLSMSYSCHFPSTTSIHANDFMPAILAWFSARHTPEPRIFCFQEHLTYDPPITPSSRLCSMQGRDISLPNKRRSSEIGTARGTRYSALQEGAFDACVGKRGARRALFCNGCPIAQQL